MNDWLLPNSRCTSTEYCCTRGAVLFWSTKLIVVPTPLAFGYARMYELHAAETQIHSRVVYTRTDGLAWLDAKRQAQEDWSTEEARDAWEASENLT